MNEDASPLEQPVKEGDKDSLPKAFVGSELVRLTEAQRKQNGFSGVLFTDIDGTFSRKDREAASDVLSKKAKKNNFPIVAVTGNNFSVVRQRINSGELPYFEAIAGSVGTELYMLHVGANGIKTYVKDEAHAQEMLNKGFDRLTLVRIAEEMVESLRIDNRFSLDFLKPEIEKAYLKGEKGDVEPFKISFYAFASSLESLGSMREEVVSRFPDQKVVICEDTDYNERMIPGDLRKKYNVDVLPVTKADVVDYISNIARVDVGLVAGDSGNDESMLTEAGDVSISVGGSRRELERVIEDVTAESKGRGSFKKVVTKKGKTKFYYHESGNRRGAESIDYATEILMRAQRRFKPKLSSASA